MVSFRTKEKVSKILYIIAIILMMLNLFNKGTDTENKIMEYSSWLALVIAALYEIYLSREKKKELSESNKV